MCLNVEYANILHEKCAFCGHYLRNDEKDKNFHDTYQGKEYKPLCFPCVQKLY